MAHRVYTGDLSCAQSARRNATS